MKSSAARLTVEECWTLDVNQLHCDGCLEPGCIGTTEWQRYGSAMARISRRMEDEHLILSYQCRTQGYGAQDVEEIVPIIRVPCPYGGSRPYFLCPGVVNGIYCGRRVAHLHLATRYFVCRHCNDLAYSSQRENISARATRKADKLRARLGDGIGWLGYPVRPKGMWDRTFQRMRTEIAVAEARSADSCATGWL